MNYGDHYGYRTEEDEPCRGGVSLGGEHRRPPVVHDPLLSLGLAVDRKFKDAERDRKETERNRALVQSPMPPSSGRRKQHDEQHQCGGEKAAGGNRYNNGAWRHNLRRIRENPPLKANKFTPMHPARFRAVIGFPGWWSSVSRPKASSAEEAP